MALTDKELSNSWSLHQDAKGMTGTKKYLVPVASMFDPSLPVPGTPWPGPGVLPYLCCITGDWDDYEDQTDLVVAVYQFSTERQLGEDFFEASLDPGLEVVDRTRGFLWRDVGTPVELEIPTVTPQATYSLRMKRSGPPFSLICQVINTVNLKRFHGFEPETLRFDGASTDSSYTITGETVSVSTVYKFTARSVSHNYAWRAPLGDRDGEGNQLFYQDKDSSKTDTYTTNPALVGTQKYVIGPAGIANWDVPVQGTLLRYDSVDFASVLDLPTIPGDG